jgi:hypothetical protein
MRLLIYLSLNLGGQISWDQWFFSVVLQPAWAILAARAREAFSIAAEVSNSADIFCNKMMVGLYTVLQEMSSFPMSVANNLCDLPLSKYLDSKTVLIYCPHPVFIFPAKSIREGVLKQFEADRSSPSPAFPPPPLDI